MFPQSGSPGRPPNQIACSPRCLPLRRLARPTATVSTNIITRCKLMGLLAVLADLQHCKNAKQLALEMTLRRRRKRRQKLMAFTPEARQDTTSRMNNNCLSATKKCSNRLIESRDRTGSTQDERKECAAVACVLAGSRETNRRDPRGTGADKLRTRCRTRSGGCAKRPNKKKCNRMLALAAVTAIYKRKHKI